MGTCTKQQVGPLPYFLEKYSPPYFARTLTLRQASRLSAILEPRGALLTPDELSQLPGFRRLAKKRLARIVAAFTPREGLDKGQAVELVGFLLHSDDQQLVEFIYHIYQGFSSITLFTEFAAQNDSCYFGPVSIPRHRYNLKQITSYLNKRFSFKKFRESFDLLNSSSEKMMLETVFKLKDHGFVVERKWLIRWQVYIKSTPQLDSYNQSAAKQAGDYPGPIPNHTLTRDKLRINPHLRLGLDMQIINPEVWHQLIKIYGGGPAFQRKRVQGQFDLYPLVFSYFGQKRKQLVYKYQSKSQKWPAEPNVHFLGLDHSWHLLDNQLSFQEQGLFGQVFVYIGEGPPAKQVSRVLPQSFDFFQCKSRNKIPDLGNSSCLVACLRLLPSLIKIDSASLLYGLATSQYYNNSLIRQLYKLVRKYREYLFDPAAMLQQMLLDFSSTSRSEVALTCQTHCHSCNYHKSVMESGPFLSLQLRVQRPVLRVYKAVGISYHEEECCQGNWATIGQLRNEVFGCGVRARLFCLNGWDMSQIGQCMDHLTVKEVGLTDNDQLVFYGPSCALTRANSPLLPLSLTQIRTSEMTPRGRLFQNESLVDLRVDGLAESGLLLRKQDKEYCVLLRDRFLRQREVRCGQVFLHRTLRFQAEQVSLKCIMAKTAKEGVDRLGHPFLLRLDRKDTLRTLRTRVKNMKWSSELLNVCLMFEMDYSCIFCRNTRGGCFCLAANEKLTLEWTTSSIQSYVVLLLWKVEPTQAKRILRTSSSSKPVLLSQLLAQHIQAKDLLTPCPDCGARQLSRRKAIFSPPQALLIRLRAQDVDGWTPLESAPIDLQQQTVSLDCNGCVFEYRVWCAVCRVGDSRGGEFLFESREGQEWRVLGCGVDSLQAKPMGEVQLLLLTLVRYQRE